MNMKLAAMLFALTTLVTGTAAAAGNVADATDLQALRASVRADKKALVAATLQLTDAEARKFWPLYDAYQRDLDLINRRRVVAVEGLIARDKPLSDLYARTLANELLVTDEMEIKSRRTLQNGVLKALPAKKAARYLQLENKIRAVQAYDVAEAIPLIN
jgi:Spy/CpxP family protein refolding chaperone